MNLRSLALVAVVVLSPLARAAEPAAPAWSWAGWGGGGLYWSAAFHPQRDGVIYLGGDVAGVYKSEDHGQTWRLSNQGLADYAVYSLAVDRATPDTVYAATEGGLCKSTDAGEHWRLLPNTGRGGLRLTGERGKSVRAVAVDPTNSQVVYAASPGGRVYRSADGGETWAVAWQKAAEPGPADALRVQFGKVNDAWHGGFWTPLAFPQGVASADCVGFGLTFQGDGNLPRDFIITLKAADGTAYRSKNVRELFGQTQSADVVLRAGDFVLDPEWAKANPAKAQAYGGTPDWGTINRVDIVCVGPLMNQMSVGWFTRLDFAVTRTADGKTYPADAPCPLPVKTFGPGQTVQIYGNARAGSGAGSSGPVRAVSVAQGDPNTVAAATDDAGVVLSRDGGKSWRELATPKQVQSVVFAASDAKVMYAACGKDGLRKSTDGGETWQNVSAGLPPNSSFIEVAVSPANPLDVYAIGAVGWNGTFVASHDGGATWTVSAQVKPDAAADPTLVEDYHGTTGLSAPKNLAINPLHPEELYLAANWRPCWSGDAGRTWTERDRGADISCIQDLRFHAGRTYASAMDEGIAVSSDDGKTWRAVWPRRWDREYSGHYWRLAISDQGGVDRIVATCSPWDSPPNRVVISGDGGKTFTRTVAGLPATNPTANTMWGTGYARALAADPKDPRVLYLGIDGDPAGGKEGGGVFKSEDGGQTWHALPAQPASRRMFFGLAVDPTDSKRLWWGACGTGGGVWRSDDAGASWQQVFKGEGWVFNLLVTDDGTVYCPGKDLWRSADHGATWQRLTKHGNTPRVIVGLETDPDDPKRLWYSSLTWGSGAEGDVYETTDGGTTWRTITSDLPYRKPIVLRYNPETHELWAAGVGLFKCQR